MVEPATPTPAEPEKLALVAEDDLYIAPIMKLSLERLGYKVALVETLDAALAELPKKPDLLVTDFGLLGDKQGGTKLIKAARAQTPDLPVLMVTGNKTEAAPELEAIGAARTVPIMEKPFRINALEYMVEAAKKRASGKGLPSETYGNDVEEQRENSGGDALPGNLGG